ncbi:MAG: FecR domain-containing protein [Arcobacteraceae bacterium]|nr:FecR domain-containing protein [Arcobacteraceae bacterium]
MKILLLSVLIFTTTLFANIGKISALSGEVNISRDSKTIPATIGFELQEKDKIATSSNARAQLLFNDKTIISLGKNSTFDIEEYFYDIQKPTQTKASFKVAKGIFKTITGQIGKVNPNKFTLKTRSASIGIRGTIFFGDIPPEPTQPEILSCSDGIIEVFTPAGIQQVGANQFTTVKPNQAPTPPQDMKPKQKADAEKNSGASENEKESGQDENVFYQSNTPTQDGGIDVGNPDPVNNDADNLAQNTISDKLDSEATDTINTLQTSVHYTTISSTTISSSDIDYSLMSSTNSDYNSIISKLGTGYIIDIPDSQSDGTNLSLNSGEDSFDWGFWGNSSITHPEPGLNEFTVEKAWITAKNLVTDISSLSGTASYSGKIMGVTSGGTFIDPTNTSTITLDFNFGSNKVDVSTQINNSTGFNIIAGDYTTSGSVYTITDNAQQTGSLQGSFYDNFNTTAGTFDVSGNKGVYKATKQ